MIQAVKASKESGERPQPTCKDCKEIGHYNKNTINASFLKRTKLMMTWVKLNGNKCEATGVLSRAFKKREKEVGLLVVTIDEFMTLRNCNISYEDLLKKVEGVKGYSVLGC
ncbi:hypothetical protein INT46_000727 [Mucor plumbeus]|uniref:Uncharacterized protein n=1 Tax=Mucor plumbeus TaxID=97098 RepID=A0A8H7QTP4_9FUNG|nr:hypothetical protein INT46_000727 [Mucor plumbeus]